MEATHTLIMSNETNPAEVAFVKGKPGIRIWADLGISMMHDNKGEWLIRQADPDIAEEDLDEEGSVWISNDVIAELFRVAVIMSAVEDSP